MVFPEYCNQKRAGMAILTSNKIDFNIKTVTRDKEEYFIMKKMSIHQEDITIYTLATSEHLHIENKHWQNEREIDCNTVIAGDFNVPHSTTEITSRQKINKEMVDFNNISIQIDLT